MASISSKFSFIIFFLTLLTTQKIHARESQFFNKIPTNNNNNNNNLANENQPKEEDPLDKLEQEPTFIPVENQNGGGGGGGYGLYGHESGQLPPSTTTTTTTPANVVNTNLPFKNEPNNNYEFVPKYLPKNYNTEAYVTEAEGYHPAQETNTNNNYYNADIDVDSQIPKQSYPATTTTAANEGVNYYQNPKQSYPATTTTAANEGDNYYQKYGGNSYNGHSAQETDTNNYYNAGIDVNSQNPKQSYPATTTSTTNEGESYYQKYGGNSYNGQQQGLNEYNFGQKGYTTTTTSGGEKYSNNYYNAAEKQGMSDTRFLENGKYFYDLSLEKNDKYPFDSSSSTTRFDDQYKKYGGYNGNSINENTYGEQFQDLQDDEGLP